VYAENRKLIFSPNETMLSSCVHLSGRLSVCQKSELYKKGKT